jgi:hypothetical protein
MLETIIERSFFLKGQREAPLLEERERFLLYLQQQGTNRSALANSSKRTDPCKCGSLD